MRLKNGFWILIIIGIISCKQKTTEKRVELDTTPKIVSLDNEEAINEMLKLNLDSIYPNLLDPRNIPESEYTDVIKSWSEFHEKISEHIKKENFKWEVPDSTIKVSNRIYFDKSGKVKYYFFKVLNPNISSAKQKEYVSLLVKFSTSEKIGLERENNFAQCGSIKYLNY